METGFLPSSIAENHVPWKTTKGELDEITTSISSSSSPWYVVPGMLMQHQANQQTKFAQQLHRLIPTLLEMDATISLWW